MRIIPREAGCVRSLELIHALKDAGLRIIDPAEIAGDLAPVLKRKLVREVEKSCYITHLEHHPIRSLHYQWVYHDSAGACLRWINQGEGLPTELAAGFAEALMARAR